MPLLNGAPLTNNEGTPRCKRISEVNVCISIFLPLRKNLQLHIHENAINVFRKLIIYLCDDMKRNKDAPTATRPEYLNILAREPINYYACLKTFNQSLPDQINIFCRKNHKTSYYSIHHRFVLTFNLKTSGALCINNKRVIFPEQTFNLVVPYQYHYVIPTPSPLCWLSFTFEISNWDAAELLQDHPRMITTKIRRLMNDCLDTYFAPAPESERANELALRLALLLNALPHAPAIPAGTNQTSKPAFKPNLYNHSRIVSKALQMIQTNLDRHLTIPRIAAAAGVSASHLRLIFRRQMHMSLGRYIHIARIQKATVMLKKSSLSIKEIATAAGFVSTSSFDQAFLKETGSCPMAYREQK